MERPMADMTVEEILNQWPATVPVFMQHRMACVGCDLAGFETLAEAVAIYGLDLTAFLAELSNAINPTIVG
ncbi:MAG: DUF1858 domain-containing protein [Anaerolineae bacterium]